MTLSHRTLPPALQPLALAAALWAALPAFAQGVVEMDLPDGSSFVSAYDVSANGQMVIGYGVSQMNYEAFVWTPTGMRILAPLDGHASAMARAISDSGDVIVGSSMPNAYGTGLAARWTSDGVAALAPLDIHTQSGAEAVSADGQVAVGFSATNSGSSQAVRWVGTGPAQGLGFLPNHFTSRATGVNADGSVVVGNSLNFATDSTAFRWTQEHDIQPINTPGATSTANGVNADGTVVVGSYTPMWGAAKAYRWVVGNDGITGTSIDLGVVDPVKHDRSWALAVDASGDVVVGYSTNQMNDSRQAFRWSLAQGMQSVEQWLTDAGVNVNPNAPRTAKANGVSADGSVVVGELDNKRAFVARVASYGGGKGDGGGSGLIAVDEYFGTLAAAATTVALPLRDADPVLHGAHGSPMDWLLEPGKTSVRVAGDIARTERGGVDSEQTLGEFGVAHAFSPTLQGQFSLGASRSRQVLPFDGSARLRSTYVVPELIWQAAPGLYASLTGYYSDGSLRVNRGYLNAGMPDFSYGETDSTTTALRARLDWRDLWRWNAVSFTPYASLTHSRTRVDAYSESGGGFAARWDARKETQDVLRVGLDGAKTFDNDLRFTGRVELGHRLGGNGSAVATGEILGLMPFAIESAPSQRREWLRLGLGIDLSLGPGRLATTLNATTQGSAPAYWIAASYRVDF